MANYFSCLRFLGSWFCNWPGPAQIPTNNRELPNVKLDTTHMGEYLQILLKVKTSSLQQTKLKSES